MSPSERNRAYLAWLGAVLAPFAIAVLLASFVWAPEAIASGAPVRLLGLEPRSCAACGLSRAFSAASHMRLADAVAWNPGVVLSYPLAWLVALGGPALFVRHLGRHLARGAIRRRV